ncbi:MAG TPA: hypothetical protein PLU30_17720 [Verrucomicrobiae bacterium]|nr:hypothetical protein [Verrucomicrobiae bacterium]
MDPVKYCIPAAALVTLLVGCATTGTGTGSMGGVDLAQLNANPPAYWIGHRVYNPKYQTWGYVKRPEDTWSKSFPIVLYEHEAMAPDRSMESRGADHNFQYKLYGHFWDKKGYEPVLNRLFPVFVLQSFEPIGDAGELNLPKMNRRIVQERESTAASRSSGVTSGQQRSRRSSGGASYERIDY